MRSFASSMRAASMPSIVIAFGFRIFFLTILDDNATRFAKDAKVLNAPTAFLGGFNVGATNGAEDLAERSICMISSDAHPFLKAPARCHTITK